MPSNEGSALLSSAKSSDSHLSVQLHPIVILTISDYITRHSLRRQQSPIVGAILGAQNGRTITMEQAFECATETNSADEVIINEGWFHERLQQYKDVHKAPALDLVGWFALSSPSGPSPHHLPIQRQILTTYNESALLLLFHPSNINAKGGKLPLTIYESVYEAAPEDDDSTMKETGEGPSLMLRFKELSYSVETAEAEMIGVDFVAKGSANAAPLSSEASVLASQANSKTTGKGKGKAAAASSQMLDTSPPQSDILSPEEEDAIAALTSKANAIRMLSQRISLLKSYVDSLPPCYLNDASVSEVKEHPQISHTILRSINSLLARLPLLTPSTPVSTSSSTTPASTNPTTQSHPQRNQELSAYNAQSTSESADVALISLLGALGSTLYSAQALGRKAGVVEGQRSAAAKKTGGSGSGGGAGYGGGGGFGGGAGYGGAGGGFGGGGGFSSGAFGGSGGGKGKGYSSGRSAGAGDGGILFDSGNDGKMAPPEWAGVSRGAGRGRSGGVSFRSDGR